MLVGRHVECSRLASLVDAIRAGDGDAVLLRGVAGAGKSALLEYTVECAEGLTVLRGSGVPAESEVAFAGALDVLQPVLDLLTGLPPPQQEALGGALGLVQAAERDRFLVGAATLGLLLRASAGRPVLACVDDVHWLDAPSLEALLFAARRLAGAPVGMVLAARDDPHPLLDDARLAELPVPPLDREATGVLAARLIGREPGKGEAEEIFRRTQGLPLAIAEWSRLGDPDEATSAPVPISRLVERAYARGVEAAPEPVQALLLVAAADDSGDLATVLAAAARLGIPADAAVVAEELGFVKADAGRLQFRHPLVRSAVYQSADAPLRRRAHGALAACLDGKWQADRRAWHRSAAVARPDEGVAAELAAMAERTRARSGYAVAARAHERAARFTPAPARRTARMIAAAEAFWLAGRGPHAEALLRSARDEAPDPLLSADAEHQLARMLHWRGEPAAARDILVAQALRIERLDPRRATDLMATALHASWFCPRRDLVRDTAATLARLAGPADAEDDPHLAAMTGAALTMCERPADAEPYLRRSIQLAERADPFALVYAATSYGWLCDYRAARELNARALDEGRDQGAIGAEAFASEMLAEYEFALGNLDAASAIWTEGARSAAEAEQSHPLAWCLASLASLTAFREGEAEVRRIVDSALDAESPLRYIGVDAAAWALGTAALARGDGETAARLHDATDLTISQANYSPWSISADVVEAHVRTGDAARAEATLLALAPHTHQPWARAALDRARGLVAGEDAFDAPLERSVREYARLGVRLDEARSRLCHGERLRRAGRRVQARTQLRAALALFEDMRCAPWIERTETELRASGETLRARGPGSPVDDLTPQERQVAMLAAAGLSNKEAATQLFLSVKTIEAHLHRAYRKLGVGSRAELAPLLGELDRAYASRTAGSPRPRTSRTTRS
jgi:DNA-binding CsgD family transcriptional regulator